MRFEVPSGLGLRTGLRLRERWGGDSGAGLCAFTTTGLGLLLLLGVSLGLLLWLRFGLTTGLMLGLNLGLSLWLWLLLRLRLGLLLGVRLLLRLLHIHLHHTRVAETKIEIMLLEPITTGLMKQPSTLLKMAEDARNFQSD